ncbi:TPA: acyl-CoA dehydrogenase, partial [Burkholderia multivorans]|nr:acyl-CoA dehydrogenase [Burkholderia multivorans]
GNHGLSRRNPLERHYRDVLCSRVHTPQDDAIAVAAGRAALDAAARRTAGEGAGEGRTTPRASASGRSDA